MFDPNRVPRVSAIEARSRLDGVGAEPGDARALLVDVRELDEFSQVRAENAVLFPLSTFVSRLAQLPRDRSLLMICHSGSRSGQATAYLLANGWPDVANVEGGMLAWLRAGLPVRRGVPAAGEGDLPG